MTKRKDEIGLSARVRAYVSRESGAAELEISPDTWDAWVREGRLPPPAPGFPASTPRWRWEDVDLCLSGKLPGGEDPAMARIGTVFGDGSKKERRRAA